VKIKSPFIKHGVCFTVARHAVDTCTIFCFTSNCPYRQTSCLLRCIKLCFFVFWRDSPPSGPGPSHSRRFYITHNDVPQSVGLLWTIDQLVYLTTYPHSRQTSMPPVGFEPTISAGEWPQTHATAYKVLFVRTATSQKSSDRYFR